MIIVILNNYIYLAIVDFWTQYDDSNNKNESIILFGLNTIIIFIVVRNQMLLSKNKTQQNMVTHSISRKGLLVNADPPHDTKTGPEVYCFY